MRIIGIKISSRRINFFVSIIRVVPNHNYAAWFFPISRTLRSHKNLVQMKSSFDSSAVHSFNYQPFHSCDKQDRRISPVPVYLSVQEFLPLRNWTPDPVSIHMIRGRRRLRLTISRAFSFAIQFRGTSPQRQRTRETQRHWL